VGGSASPISKLKFRIIVILQFHPQYHSFE
jgi:hypothetical protein